MSIRPKRRTVRRCCACVVVLSMSLPALAASDAQRLPRPRPAVETPAPAAPNETSARVPKSRPSDGAQAEMTAWARGVESRFRAAAADLEAIVPAVEQDIRADAPGGLAAAAGLARIPHPRPEPSALLAMAKPGAPVELAGAGLSPRIAEPEDTACLARLAALGVAFTKQAPIEDGLCWVEHPLNVTSLGSGVAIVPEAILNCRTAEALAMWTRDVLIPSARDLLGATPKEIVHGSAYVCRTRNNDPDAKLSEHAHANAVDISSIAFAERQPLDIADRDMTSGEGRFQVAIRGGSCAYFTTVLGPRSDASHATHFHFDMAERRGGYRLCDLADTNFVGVEEP